MKKIIIILPLVLSCTCIFGQKELSGFYKLDKEIVLDTIFYHTFWENKFRKVKINVYEKKQISKNIIFTSYHSDSTYILGKAIVINHKQNIRKTYIWDPYYGLYYIGEIRIENKNRDWIKSYINYADETVKIVTDYTTEPNTEKRFIRSEYRRDLSIVKTFPEYFKKLYREKYGEIKPN